MTVTRTSRCASTLVRLYQGALQLQDISLPLGDYYEVCEMVRERVGEWATRVVLYGHLGDGNAHLNITSPEFDQRIQDA